MIQVIDYLKANQFDVYIVTGAGAAFVRPWSEAIYHIPAQNVIGTTFGYSYKQVNGKAQLVKNDKLIYVNDGPQKAINIETIIGKRPIVAIGNSTGDAAMLDWTTSQKGESFAMLIHHTDQEREWSYGPSSFVDKTELILSLMNVLNSIAIGLIYLGFVVNTKCKGNDSNPQFLPTILSLFSIISG